MITDIYFHVWHHNTAPPTPPARPLHYNTLSPAAHVSANAPKTG